MKLIVLFFAKGVMEAHSGRVRGLASRDRPANYSIGIYLIFTSQGDVVLQEFGDAIVDKEQIKSLENIIHNKLK